MQFLPSVLLLAHASTRPGPHALKKIEHGYSLKAGLDLAWAAAPLAVSERGGQMTVALRDPGVEI